MEDRKNIVIKVKYPTNGKSKANVSQPKVIEQWDIKRIAIAAGGLLVFLIVLITVFFSGDDSAPNNESSSAIVNKAPATDVAKASTQNAVDKPVSKAEQPAFKNIDYSKSVLRSTLTFAIKGNEPQGRVTSPLHLSKTKPVSVFYFAELNDMTGRTVYIEWLLEGDLITRKKVNISGDHWRMTSRQYLNDNIKTHWVVRVADDRGQVITQIPFDAIYE